MSKPTDYDTLVGVFLNDIQRKNPTARTASTYRTALNELGTWLDGLGEPVYGPARRKGRTVIVPGAIEETGDLTSDHLRAHITHLQTRDQLPAGRGGCVSRAGRKLAPGTVNNRYRAISSFMSWLHRNEEFADERGLGANPIAPLEAPSLEENPVTPLTLEQVKALIATCGKGRKRSFLDTRDEAILRLFFEAGGRRTEIATAQLVGLNMSTRVLRVYGRHTKTNQGRDIPFGDKTALAINRYLAARAKHKHNKRPELWLATKGALSTGGLYQMIRRRGDLAGVRLHPHQFRHTFANVYLKNGGTEESLQRIGGWESIKMVRRYSRAQSDERAREEHAELALGDLI